MRNRYVLLAVLLPVIGACSDGGSTNSSVPAATTQVAAAATAPASASASANENAIGIANFRFIPAEVHVAVGSSVVWTNNDGQQHTATSAGNFDAGAMQPGASATVAFPTAGTFAYICSFHPFMAATVIVG